VTGVAGNEVLMLRVPWLLGSGGGGDGGGGGGCGASSPCFKRSRAKFMARYCWSWSVTRLANFRTVSVRGCRGQSKSSMMTNRLARSSTVVADSFPVPAPAEEAMVGEPG
jgi:hypothetical protein